MKKWNLIKFDISYNIAKKPVILVYLFVFPFLIFALLGYLTTGSFSGGISSFDYYGLTIIIYFQLTMGTMISNMIMEENVKLPNIRIAYSLEDENYIYISKIIALTLANAISIGVYMLLLMKIYHVNFGANPFMVYITYMILGLFSTCLGTALCIGLKDESVCNNILGVVQIILCIFGGIFFPITYLGKIGIFLSNFSIVKWINYGIGSYVYGQSIKGQLIVWVFSLLLAALLLFAARKMFKIQLFIH
ncbi:ABC transporter permease [Streptococcus mutans]|nr:ABC transporter permease [Streptococcus mutans]